MKKIFRKSVYNKLLLLCLVLLIIPSSVIGIQSYQTSKTELDNKGKVILKNGVKQVIQLIEAKQQEVEGREKTLEEAQEEVKVIILGEKREDGTRPIENDIDLGENGYFFILDEEAVEIAHPTIEGENTWNVKDKSGKDYYFAQDMIKKAMNGGGFVEYSWELPNSKKIAPKITYAEYDEKWGWVVAAGTYERDFNQGSNKVIYIVLITLAISFILGFIIILLFANHLSNPIKKITGSLEKIADGDLTIDTINIKNKDETGKLANSFNKMLKNLKEVVGTVNESSNTVSQASSSLSAIARETAVAIEEVAHTVSEIANSSSEQANNVENGSIQINDLGKSIEEISSISREMNDISKETRGLTENGFKIVEILTEKSKENSRATQNVNEMILKVNDSTGQIEVITETIEQIAEQTNLLALNASIEAARAGDAGKGFAVVADEIRKLAEQSSKSIQGINRILEDIRGNSKNAVNSMENTKNIVDKQSKAVSNTEKIFNEILNIILNLTEKVEDVSNHSISMNDKKESIINMIESLSAISEQTAAATQQASANTEEQAASIQQVSNYAENLENLANRLLNAVSNFNIK